MVSGKRLGKCGGLVPGEADSPQPPQAELRRGHLISFEVADNTNSMATYGNLWYSPQLLYSIQGDWKA